MKLPMSDSEIARRYRNSLDQKKAVKILAQLNDTAPSDIKAALARQGVELAPIPARKKPTRIDQQEARKLYDLGMNDNEIAERLGASSIGVYHWRERNKLTANTSRNRGSRR